VHIARTVASGDLTTKAQITTKDECGQLLQSMQEMNDSLVHIVNQVRGGTDLMAAATHEIADGNMDFLLVPKSKPARLSKLRPRWSNWHRR
jgi:methyl-accepting chemotaxis protein